MAAGNYDKLEYNEKNGNNIGPQLLFSLPFLAFFLLLNYTTEKNRKLETNNLTIESKTEQMQSDQKHFRKKTEIPLADQVGSGYISKNPPPIASLFGENVNFQPSKICPRNFIIFDRTDNRSQIMYHPAVGPGFGYPGLNYIKDRMVVRNDMNDPREIESVMKEDSADIDLLLSFEEDDDEYEEEEDEEEVSTGRTHGNDASDTADSCSSRPLRKSGLGVLSSSCSQKSSERKREKMRKMVNSLRGIVPGGNQMNTVGVLDEAVKYLKSLKVELQKVEN